MMWFPFMGFGWGMIVVPIIILAGVIFLIVWGIKKATERNYSPTRGSPIDIARERYARGEISREEFERLKQDLS